MSARSKIVV